MSNIEKELTAKEKSEIKTSSTNKPQETPTQTEIIIEKGKHGFEIQETRFVKELNANVYMYKHSKTGARLMHIDADDTNKVFSIAFRTPPENSTGVAHIVEHAVLNGSEKYPSKEPFVDLLKGSLYTFLNAMTGNDFTVYPVASTNDKDFKILSEVYLDAVFFPNIRTVDEIFYQEGWHYDMESKDDDLKIKGVVYNEMKGSYSDPNRIMQQLLTEIIFPDTVYKYCSGGKPVDIPDLTLEDFRAYHAKYYHPSNSYFYLYGKIDVEEMMTLINNEALNKFAIENTTKTDLFSLNNEILGIKPQPLFSKPVEKESSYSISPEDDENEKVWFGMSFLLDLNYNPSLYFSFRVITHLLLNTAASPLKRAFLQAEICKDVFGGFDTNTLQPYFYIIMKDSKIENKDMFKKIFFDTLKDLCETGIDKQLIEASISIYEFYLREADMGSYPKGFVYLWNSLSDWIHDKDPILPLCYEDVLTDTKTSLTSNFYETMIQKYIIENQHYGMITMKAKKGLAEKVYDKVDENLAEIKKSLNEKDIEKIVETTKKLVERQLTPDPKEVTDKIPSLTLDDINLMAENFNFTLRRDVKAHLMYHEHDFFTNGIVYLRLYFRPKSIPQNLLQYAKALTYILGRIHTKKHHYIELTNLKNIHTGGINFTFAAFESYKFEDNYEPFFVVTSKAMKPKTSTMIELIKEIIIETRFDDFIRLKEILNEHKLNMEMMLMQAGDYFADKRLCAYIKETGKFNETIEGVEYYFFLKNILSNFDQNKNEIIQKFYETFGLIFNKTGLHVSVTAPTEDIYHTKNCLEMLYQDCQDFVSTPVKYNFDFSVKNEAFVLPGLVQYVAKGYSFKKLFEEDKKFQYHGEMDVLENYLELDYIWNKIRVQGGAYGGEFSISHNGMVVANSYRDPNLSESLKVYDELPTYLKSQSLTKKEFVKYIIGTIRKFDTPKSPSRKSYLADFYHFTNKNSLQIQEQRYQVLSADFNRVKTYAEMIEEIMKKNYYCVFGSEGKIKKDKDLFKKIVNVL
ncbi:MAG: insulinase family protein [Candidatus Cloacimonetes bacterium]|nr:insulinase family protein [Candidatus Cloacimonadota bacterium]